MTTRKPDLDERRESIALAATCCHLGHGIHVDSDGREGHYIVSVNPLNRPTIERVVKAIKAVLD